MNSSVQNLEEEKESSPTKKKSSNLKKSIPGLRLSDLKPLMLACSSLLTEVERDKAKDAGFVHCFLNPLSQKIIKESILPVMEFRRKELEELMILKN